MKISLMKRHRMLEKCMGADRGTEARAALLEKLADKWEAQVLVAREAVEALGQIHMELELLGIEAGFDTWDEPEAQRARFQADEMSSWLKIHGDTPVRARAMARAARLLSAAGDAYQLKALRRIWKAPAIVLDYASARTLWMMAERCGCGWCMDCGFRAGGEAWWKRGQFPSKRKARP